MFGPGCKRNPLSILLGDFALRAPALTSFVVNVPIIPILVYSRSVHVLIHNVISYAKSMSIETLGLECFLSIAALLIVVVFFDSALSFVSL